MACSCSREDVEPVPVRESGALPEDARVRILLADLADSVSRFVEDPSPQAVYF